MAKWGKYSAAHAPGWSHVLADYHVISKSAKVQGLILKRNIRTEKDNLGTTVSEDPQKAILVAFG
jgi:hypothetical protein